MPDLRGGDRSALGRGPVALRRLARARGLGHVRRQARGPAGRQAPPALRGIQGTSAAQGLSHRQAPAAHRADEARGASARARRPAPEAHAMTIPREVSETENEGLFAAGKKPVRIAPASGREKRSYYLNMGPQHPAMHGVIRLLLELDGEKVVDAE